MAGTALFGRIGNLVSRAFETVGRALRRPLRLSIFGWSRHERGPQTRTGDFRSYIAGLFRSEWAIAGVMRIVDAIMFHEWEIVDGENNTVEDRSLPVYRIFDRPNPVQDWVDFIESILWFWVPLGNAFIWLRPSKFDPTLPAQLWVLWPDSIEIVPDETGRSIREYKVLENGQTYTLPREQVLHIRTGNPVRRHWGLGPMEAAERVFDLDIAAGEYGINYFENDATPGGVLKTSGRLHADTRRALKEDWDEHHRGEHRAHNWTILEEGLDWQTLNQSPREALFLETRKSTREVILAMFGVTPEKVGLLENSNKSTSFVSERSWQRDTIAPKLKRLNRYLTIIAKMFGPYGFKFEELVQEDAVEDTQIAAGYFNLGAITPNEVRTIYAGLPRIEGVDAMDVTYLPVSAIEAGKEPPAIGFTVDPSNPGAPAPHPANGNGKAKGYMPLFSPGPRSADDDGASRTGGRRKQDEPKPEAVVPPKDRPKGTPVQQRVLRSYRQQQLHQTRVMRRKIAAFFRDQGGRVISRFLNGKGADHAQAAIVSFNAKKYSEAAELIRKGLEDAFDMTADERAWTVIVRGMFGDALVEEYDVTARLLRIPEDPEKAGVPFGPGDPAFDRRVNRLASRVTRVTETTRATLAELVQRGVDLGLSPAQIAEGAPAQGFEGIRGMFEEMSQSRAQLIARTESARALDQANTALFQRIGVQVVDVIGCEDNVIMPGQKYGCNSQGIPAGEAGSIEFHPNHKGAIVPRIASASRLVDLFDTGRGDMA